METTEAYESQIPEHNTATAIKELDDGGQSISLLNLDSTPPVFSSSNLAPI